MGNGIVEAAEGLRRTKEMAKSRANCPVYRFGR